MESNSARASSKLGPHGKAPWATPIDGGRLQVLRDASPLQFAPPEPDDAATFDWRTAASRYPGPMAGVGPTVTLARMCRNPGARGPVGYLPHNGRDFRLVFLLQWRDVPMAVNGPAPGSGAVRDAPLRQIGFVIGCVDAISGEQLSRTTTNRVDPRTSH